MDRTLTLHVTQITLLSPVVSLHVCSTLHARDMREMQFDESPLFDALCGNEIPRLDAGVMAPPPGPGLGVSLDRSLLDMHAAAPAQVWRSA